MLSTSEVEIDRLPQVARADAAAFEQPYADFDVDFLYNSLFCDSLPLFRRDPSQAGAQSGPLLRDPVAEPELRGIIASESAPSRQRAIACRRLHSVGAALDHRGVFGVVVEFSLAHSQETLAAYADGNVCWIRSDGEHRAFEATAASGSVARVRKLIAAAARLAQRCADAQVRGAPPRNGKIRITLIAGAGLFVVEGPMSALQKDPWSGPVLGNAIGLWQMHAYGSPA